MELLTRKQVAKILNVDVRTVDNRVLNKDLPVYKIGGAIRFKKSDLEDLIERSLKRK